MKDRFFLEKALKEYEKAKQTLEENVKDIEDSINIEEKEVLTVDYKFSKLTYKKVNNQWRKEENIDVFDDDGNLIYSITLTELKEMLEKDNQRIKIKFEFLKTKKI